MLGMRGNVLFTGAVNGDMCVRARMRVYMHVRQTCVPGCRCLAFGT